MAQLCVAGSSVLQKHMLTGLEEIAYLFMTSMSLTLLKKSGPITERFLDQECTYPIIHHRE